ncbi:MAG: hypothetical protein ABI186_02955 [Candidatus Elarobacter sp.]
MTRTLAALAAMVWVTASAASAQSYPDDTGAGTQRGLAQMGNSGQVGTVTLFRHDRATRIVVELHGTLPGRVQTVAVVRGPACGQLSPRAPYRLAPLRGGVSTTPALGAPEDTLLSGNYNLVVFSSNAAGARVTACGHLYA